MVLGGDDTSGSLNPKLRKASGLCQSGALLRLFFASSNVESGARWAVPG